MARRRSQFAYDGFQSDACTHVGTTEVYVPDSRLSEKR